MNVRLFTDTGAEVVGAEAAVGHHEPCARNSLVRFRREQRIAQEEVLRMGRDAVRDVREPMNGQREPGWDVRVVGMQVMDAPQSLDKTAGLAEQ